MIITAIRYQVQGRSESGDEWGWEYAAGQAEDATYRTEMAAERALDNLAETTGWGRDRLRVERIDVAGRRPSLTRRARHGGVL